MFWGGYLLWIEGKLFIISSKLCVSENFSVGRFNFGLPGLFIYLFKVNDN